MVDIDDSLEALLGGNDARAASLYLVSLLVLLGGILAAAAIPIDVDVRAPATLRPASERQTLRALVDGIVERVGTSRGQLVRRGDTIVLLRSNPSSSALDAARAAHHEQRALARDLRVMLTAAASTDDPSSVLGRLQLERSRAALSEAHAEWRQLSVDVRRAQQTAERLRQLIRRGVAVPAELESAELELTGAQESRALALERRRAHWSSELAESEERSRDLSRTIAAASTDKANRAILAPISGTVEELAAVTPASAVRAGDAIATVSPDTALVAEALLSPRDVGWVRPGMRVRLLIDGYDVQEWGAANGVVTSVGRDYTLAGNEPVFTVRIRLRDTDLRRPDGRVARLTKGLRAQARFVVNRRTMGQLLVHRGREWADASSPRPTYAR